MVSKSLGATVIGINSHIVTVEADISLGLPQFGIVGLPDSAVRESRDRVVAALRSVGINCHGQKITVNLAPGDLKKAGSLFDLPIAVAIFGAIGKTHIPEDFLFAGELSLDGKINPVRGILAIACAARHAGIKNCIVPFLNKEEASVVDGVNIYPAKELIDVLNHIKGVKMLTRAESISELRHSEKDSALDYADVKGQEYVKRAFMIAAAGQHNLLAIGPPGTGKTMMARRLPTIMPPLTFEESLEITKLFSIKGLTKATGSLITERPFRATHHTVSSVALVGGGNPPVPGEISLAHTGVLFLDEIAEYPRNVLEALRQPMEDKQISISRVAATSVTYPANFMLVAASNPCPCGNLGVADKCRCTEGEIAKYIGKMSGPLLDRIDIHIEMQPVGYDELSDGANSTSSAEMRENVLAAMEMQKNRFKGDGILFNSHMNEAHIKKYCILGEAESKMLEAAYKSLSLSARAYHRILRLARTIADCAGSENIGKLHIAEAISYRNMDRKLWEK